jgi:hypothetical protein
LICSFDTLIGAERGLSKRVRVSVSKTNVFERGGLLDSRVNPNTEGSYAGIWVTL